MTIRRDHIMPWFVFVLINLLHLLGIKSYLPWSQVTFLWLSDNELADLTKHFHFYRLLIAIPGLWLEDRLPTHGFSIYISFFLLLSAYLFQKSHRIVTGWPPQLWSWALLIPLFYMMNGRGAIGWAGWLLCVHASLRVMYYVKPAQPGKTVLEITLGLILSVVSSGVFVCSIMLVGLLIFKVIFRGNWQLRRLTIRQLTGWSLLLVLIPGILYLAISYFVSAVEKALRFYGSGLDGLIGVATHGIFSKIEHLSGIHLLAGFCLLIGMLLFFRSSLPSRIGWNIITIISIALFGGIFGLTILTLAFPLIIIVLGKLFRFRPAGPLV